MAASKISSKICRSSRPKSSNSSTPSSTSEKPADTTSQINRGLTLNHLVICGCLAIISMASVTMAKPPDQEAIHHKNAEFPEEDSDMLMEPNDFSPITVLRSHEQHFHMPPTTQLQPQVQARIQPRAQPRQFQVATQQNPDEEEQFRPIANPNTKIVGDSHTQAAQNFYPPFYHEAPPLGHSRPYFGHGPPVSETTPLNLPLPLLAPQQQPQPANQQRNFDASILGSGDFGVLRGGTFYPEEEMPYHPEDNSDYIYGDANNGHGRPSEGFVQKYTYPEEQFANFRDFADINTPADSAFSQFVVVYAAKNATAPHSHPHPKNIFEQLELLDREKELEKAKSQPKTSSKNKSKLSKTKLQKKYRKKAGPKIQDPLEIEPLLALS
ncbi:uncharacterized protein LOC119556434 [Drosophila subpulchrella]|uniref:uncharacterized protein LOC119556434 n=1 Tax=Drosophila subpulchrella TaxID=1486046 RepID=UPI0018A19144|nr:uncharacterized protein LOC119556434 [Drosophila subpulchrella]XP_037724592.1 uncharacterized protein LOC119556434 [Drosophila subpulchrella]XP_037724593.1 uncharacterized protein LOC119556434 [Drosophila subpulchrella]XP_037724594.1 uncharacterized protein LOC119556434 [Drosophila subpulchrella]XP_037724595.1 uncharacterized protein LOC119556434 [Drosophila subpulchrella]